jgi:putative peptidoglycan lipid II flippase
MATLPTLSEHASNHDLTAFKETTNYSLRLAFLIDIPAAMGLFILSLPIVRVIFERGVFTEQAAIATAGTLQMFALGIPFVSGVRNLVPAFFALRNPKIPVMVATLALIWNAALAPILMGPLLHRGLALAMATSSIVNFSVLFFLFRRKVGQIGGRKIAFSVARTFFAACCMAALLHFAIRFSHLLEVGKTLEKAGILVALILVAFVVYMAIIRVISPEEYHAFTSMVKKRREKQVPVTVLPDANGRIAQ